MPIIRHGYAPRKNRDNSVRAANRRAILAHADRCGICGHPPTTADPLEADHIVPIAQGGSDDIGNLRPAHRSCNRRRGQG